MKKSFSFWCWKKEWKKKKNIKNFFLIFYFVTQSINKHSCASQLFPPWPGSGRWLDIRLLSSQDCRGSHWLLVRLLTAVDDGLWLAIGLTDDCGNCSGDRRWGGWWLWGAHKCWMVSFYTILILTTLKHLNIDLLSLLLHQNGFYFT